MVEAAAAAKVRNEFQMWLFNTPDRTPEEDEEDEEEADEEWLRTMNWIMGYSVSPCANK